MRWAIQAPAWRVLSRDRFLRDSAWLILALATVSASNFALNASLGQLLGRQRYGEIAAILALVLILNVPASGIQTLMTREVNRAGSAGGAAAVFVGMRRLVLPLAAVATVLTLAASPLIARFLSLETAAAAILVAPLVGLALVLPLYRGLLQGLRRFGALTATLSFEAALRLAGAVALVVWGLRSFGVLAAFCLAAIAAILLARSLTHAERAGEHAPVAGRLSQLLPVVASLGLITVLTNLDVVLTRHFQTGELSGEYAALSLIGRVLFYATSSVGGAIVAAPELRLPAVRARVLLKGLCVVVGVGLAGEVVYIAAARPLVGALFGAGYRAEADTLPLLGAGMVAVAAANILVYFLLGMRRRGVVLSLASAVAVEAGLIAWHHDTVAQIAWAFTVSAMVALAALSALAASALRAPAWEVTA